MCSILISDDPLLMTTRCLGIHPKLSVHFISRHCKWWKGRARYSASVLERETTSCFLLRHETREVPNRKQKPGIAEVTTSPGIASPPCSHGWPTVLVLFAWDALGGCLYGHAALPSYDFGWQLGPSLFILRHFFLLGMGLGPCMKWVGAAEFFDPTIILIITNFSNFVQ